jgi:RNA polymerase sigma-B factor
METAMQRPQTTEVDRDVEQELLERYHRDGDLAARSELIERLMPLVRHIARRYANRSEPLDDLVQVGCIGLIKAVDRFDVDRGVRLSTFATPNIAGEIKRHFRDRGWFIRVPRDVQELGAKLHDTVDRLTVRLGRSPTIEELAEATEATVDEVLDAMQGSQGYSTLSFDEPIGRDGEARSALDVMGAEDEEFDTVERRVLLSDGIKQLQSRERLIVRLRFFEGLTQREIAEQVGISQMHVSRLLRRSLDEMRAAMAERTSDQPAIRAA